MTEQLAITIGQHSDKGRKDVNQDFHGALVPTGPALRLKGIALAIADGISTSNVSAIAAESAVKSFLTDYYCTSDSWTAKTAAGRVIAATNSWLYSQTRASQYAYDRDRGYVCTFSALVLKSRSAHIFHVGDSRILRLSGKSLEQLTTDHRVHVSTGQSYLGRALGVNPNVEIDYRALPVQPGEIFILATDGLAETLAAMPVADIIANAGNDLDRAARELAERAYATGAEDNLTVQIVRIDTLPAGDAREAMEPAGDLRPAPLLTARQEFEGFRIIREIHANHRSHIYLAEDLQSGTRVAIKVPAVDLRAEPAYLKRFMLEEWIGRRIHSAHVLASHERSRQPEHLYLVTEYVEGQTLAAWMQDNPKPDFAIVRDIIRQIAVGLRAFHRMEMIHQDLRPENIMIDGDGTVKIIDFGSVRVAGVAEMKTSDTEGLLGTLQYSAPECILGATATEQSDIFSLGVIAYQMLTGKLPYGAAIARAAGKSTLGRLAYRPASLERPDIPDWVDGAIEKATSADPNRRYIDVAEFEHDMTHPNAAFIGERNLPFAARNPALFWQILAFALLAIIIALLARPCS